MVLHMYARFGKVVERHKMVSIRCDNILFSAIVLLGYAIRPLLQSSYEML